MINLRACFRGHEKVRCTRDRHIYTQLQQLLPVHYDLTRRVDQFDQTMYELGLSHLLPARTNVASGAKDVPDVWRLSADELHANFRATGQTPSRSSLLNRTLADEIDYLYRADTRAFGHLFDREQA